MKSNAIHRRAVAAIGKEKKPQGAKGDCASNVHGNNIDDFAEPERGLRWREVVEFFLFFFSFLFR